MGIVFTDYKKNINKYIKLYNPQFLSWHHHSKGSLIKTFHTSLFCLTVHLWNIYSEYLQVLRICSSLYKKLSHPTLSKLQVSLLDTTSDSLGHIT